MLDQRIYRSKINSATRRLPVAPLAERETSRTSNLNINNLLCVTPPQPRFGDFGVTRHHKSDKTQYYKIRVRRGWRPTTKCSLRQKITLKYMPSASTHSNRIASRVTKMERYACVTGALRPHLHRGFLKKCLQK